MKFNNGMVSVLLVLTWQFYIAGCAGITQQSSPGEVQTFFVAAKEADLEGFQNLSPKSIDLSAYSQFMGIKYPPTQTVEVLTAPPERPYHAFAVLAGPASSVSQTEEVIERLKNKAKEIGADAIILSSASGGGSSKSPSSNARTEVLAIKYRKNQ